MDKIGNFLYKRVNKLGIKNQVEANLICEKVKNFLYDKFPYQNFVFSFKEGILKIETDNSIVSQEVRLIRAQIQRIDFNIEEIIVVIKKINKIREC